MYWLEIFCLCRVEWQKRALALRRHRARVPAVFAVLWGPSE